MKPQRFSTSPAWYRALVLVAVSILLSLSATPLWAAPTITSQPANAQVSAVKAGDTPATATFSVAATSSGGTLTYQWYLNGTAVSGANASSWTTPAVTRAGVGMVAVKVSDSTGSTWSGGAMLYYDTFQAFYDGFESGIQGSLWGTASQANWGLLQDSTTYSPLRVKNGSKAAYIQNNTKKMGHDISPTVSMNTHQRLSGWIYDDSNVGNTVALLDFRAYANGTLNNGSLQQIVAVGKYTVSPQGGAKSAVKPSKRNYAGGTTGWADLSGVTWAGTPPTGSGWHWVQSDINGSTITFYTDGTANSVTTTGETIANMSDICVGSANSGAAMTGDAWIDDVTYEIFFSAGGNPPTFGTQPTSLARARGASATFTVAATRPSPYTSADYNSDALQYQWTRNGVAVSGATGASYTIASPTSSDAGSYVCIAYYTGGATYSSTATLTIVPSIVSLTVNGQDCTGGCTYAASGGDTVTIVLTADASNPLTYQWKRNGTALGNGGHASGATTSTLVLTGIDALDAGTYSCTVTDGTNPTNSPNVILTVATCPIINSQPSPVIVAAGGTATFIVTNVAGGTPLSFEWHCTKLGTITTPSGKFSQADGARGSILSIANCSQNVADDYWCIVTNIFPCPATSSIVHLTVIDPPVITNCPVSVATYVKTNVTFHIAASGTGPFAYYWKKNGSLMSNGGRISGATTDTLVITGPIWADVGTYTCVVSNFAGTATCPGAPLTLQQDEFTFFDGFESPYPSSGLSGSPGSSGTRGGGQLDGQGLWWGWGSPNIRVYPTLTYPAPSTLVVHPVTGSQMCGGPYNGFINTSDNDRTYLNLAYQFNGQDVYYGNIMLDWYFYDIQDNNASYSDQISLCNYGAHMPLTSNSDGSKPASLSQRIAIGAWEGGDLTKYQCAVMTASDGLSGDNGGDLLGTCTYFNTSATRSAGWHHARMVVGVPNPSTHVATVSFFIDDMYSPALTHDNAGGVGFNSIDLASDVIYSGGNGQGAAGYFDDLTFRAANDPWIAQQPANQTCTYGQSVTFKVVAVGTAYQWKKNNNNVDGATGSSLTFSPVVADSGNTYTCVVSGANPNVTSSGATLTVNPAAVTVTADAKSKAYGQPDPVLTYHISSGGLVDGDTFSGALTRVSGEGVGTHAIQQGTLALSGNYSLAFVGADLTITSGLIAPTISSNSAAGLQLKIALAPVLDAWGRPPGDAVSLLSVTSPTAAGGSVSAGSTRLFYTPPAGDPASDVISYTVQDQASGATSDGVISIIFVKPGGLVQEIAYQSGGVTVLFAGIPGIAYDVQRASDPGFTTAVSIELTTNAPSMGLFIYTDPCPLPGTGYYRLKQH